MPRRPTNSRSGCVSVPHACAHAHALGSGISRLLPLPPTLQAVANGLAPVDRCADHELLKTKVFGLEFSNPLGLAAGCDKQAEAAKQFMAMGFGFVEVGSVTPQPQPGNEQPRCFRLDEDQGIINRYGFNSDGADAVLARLETLRAEGELPGVLAVNLGKNKTADAVPDYVSGVKKFKDVADLFVVNISSPNTPGLRALQGKRELTALMKAVVQVRGPSYGHGACVRVCAGRVRVGLCLRACVCVRNTYFLR